MHACLMVCPDLQEGRLQLPIIGQESDIMTALLLHDVLVLCGETGCGKTTQVRRGAGGVRVQVYN